MALPPPWIPLYKALIAVVEPDAHQVEESKELTMLAVRHLEAGGWRIVPAWAVDEDKLAGASPRFTPEDVPANTPVAPAPGEDNTTRG